MLLTYKYKLFKTDKLKQLDKLLNISRNIYNHCIALHKRYYRLYKKHLNIYQLQKHLTKLKKLKKYKHWNIVPAQSIQAITERIEEGYKLFFKARKYCNTSLSNLKKIQPPRFKSWKKFKSIPFKNTGYKFIDDSNILTIRKKYRFKYWKSREIDGKIKTMILKKDGLGDYYTHVSLDSDLILNPSATGKTGGCDFGLKTFVKTSDDTNIISPLPLFNNLDKLRKASRKLSSKKKGSNNREKAKLNLIRVHKKINNQRTDFHFKAANQLFKQFDEIKFEDLNLKGMQKLWGRKINDLGFSNFINIIEVQSKKYLHKTIKFIDRFYPSSKMCSKCKNIKDDLSLKDRIYHCLKCDLKIDRDLNAALNIKDYTEMGHRLLGEI
jgi:putative transposase